MIVPGLTDVLARLDALQAALDREQVQIREAIAAANGVHGAGAVTVVGPRLSFGDRVVARARLRGNGRVT